MRRFLAIWLGLTGLVLLATTALAPERLYANLAMAPTSTTPAGCSQATNFLARTSGLDATHTTAYTAMICGLVTDGVINGTMAASTGFNCGTIIDIFYIYATNTTANASLNLCGTGFTATQDGTPNFAADAGFTSISGFITTGGTGAIGYLPSSAGGNYTLNSASMGNWSFTSTVQTNPTQGARDTGGTVHRNELWDQFTDNNFYCELNADDGTGITAAVPNGAGFFVCNRSGASALQGYRNGVSIGTGTTTTSALDTGFSLYMNGVNMSGSPLASNRQIAMAFVGKSLTAGQVSSMNTRVCAYLTAVHGSC